MIADVLIVGGGTVGVSIAYCLGLKKPRGFRAVLLERRGGDRRASPVPEIG
jgi:2-polyprenyl-6-methoxyphenol hydroxylase-like FAD-dependent oxidoreductase